MTTRRDFIDRLAVGALAVSAMPLALNATPRLHETTLASTSQDTWDVTWSARLNTSKRALFDVPEVESGYGVWRASLWVRQYQQVLGTDPRDTSTALVIRHNAIILAMQQAFWDRYDIGTAHKVTHPLTLAPTKQNPALLGAADGVPDPYASFALDKFIARGGIALACDLALQDMVAIIKEREKVSDAEATKRARGWLVPGVIVQPSGVFAVLRAQEAGAMYIRAS
jgi:hypothetical protein